MLFTSQKALSKELELSFKLLCATTAPTRLFPPTSQTAGQLGSNTWFPAGPLNFSSNFPSAEATLLPYNWQEKISLLLRCTHGWIRIAQKRQKSMCFIAPTTTTHPPVPKRRSSRTGGCLNFTPNSPKSNTTDSIQKAAKLRASDQR